MTTKAFLKHRNVWMGVAMIWIIWFHTGIAGSSHLLAQVCSVGYGGVDIFLFASGIGCYFSLNKDPDPYRFMKRRIARLFPAWFLFMLLWLPFMVITEMMPLTAVLGNLLGIQLFTYQNNEFNWYISAIFLFYLLSPVFFGMVRASLRPWQHAAAMVLMVLFSVPFINVKEPIIAMSRLSIYYLGMIFGAICVRNTHLPRALVVGSLICIVLSGGALLYTRRMYAHHLWTHGLYWYPFILFTPGACILISAVMEFLERFPVSRYLHRILTWFGQYSFELYLVHIFVFQLTRHPWTKAFFLAGTVWKWPIAFAVTFVGVWLLHLGSEKLLKLCHRCKM